MARPHRVAIVATAMAASLTHHYGAAVRIYDDPFLATLLARIGSPDVIRAGILPAQACYEAAIEVLPPANVRIDFLNLSRVTDAAHHVTGVRLDGSKIGGPVDDALVLIPDPMGATGGTVCRAVDVYREHGGERARFVAAHLMVTPEAVQRVTAMQPGVQLYAGRLDRGLSTPRALASVPGTHPGEERGLTDVQYIVPGAGGMGELLTNSWV
jgi:uracil phosphoribosyltransferase